MQIREIRYDDRVGFLGIMKESGFVSGCTDESIEEFFKDRNNIMYVGAFDGDTVVGILSLTIGRSSYKLSPFAWCDDIYVKESHRRMGIGRQLIEKAEEIARHSNCSNLLLGVGEDEKDAISFYETVGFKDMHCRLMTLPFDDKSANLK